MFSLSLLAGTCIILYLIYKYLIFPVFISPLSKIPNAHFTSSFSPLWILWKRYSEQENRAIHAAHVEYGDIVRLGPNEVSVACVDEGIKTIYSGGFEKWAWYENQFQNFGYVSALSAVCSLNLSRLRYVQCPQRVLNDFEQRPLSAKTHDIKCLLEIVPAVITRSPCDLPDNDL